ncbi:hypothetical protein MUU48_00255, partial [Scandinavium sp. H11S7]|nr:hypothetical protein [Scandinavium hiltneri]
MAIVGKGSSSEDSGFYSPCNFLKRSLTMHPNRLSELVTLKIPAINAWLSCNSGYIAEVLGQCGFDSVTVDLQHGQFGMDVVPSLLQAISSTDAMPLVRCAENSFGDINKILDSGAY